MLKTPKNLWTAALGKLLPRMFWPPGCWVAHAWEGLCGTWQVRLHSVRGFWPPASTLSQGLVSARVTLCSKGTNLQTPVS